MGRKRVDLTGQIFERLTVRKLVTFAGNPRSYFECKCSCPSATITIVKGSDLLNGATRSCGCLRVDTMVNRRKHGACKSKYKEGDAQLDYHLWKGIKERCYSKSHPNYKRYGKIGITMCKEWRKDFMLFAQYIRTLKNCPNEEILISRSYGKRIPKSIDRINNKGNYEPGNLKWSSKKEQTRNRNNTIKVLYKGEKMSLAEVVERYSDLPYSIVVNRFSTYGWTLEEALNTPRKQRSERI